VSEELYRSVVHVAKISSTHRRATLPAEGRADMGVHGEVARHFRIEAHPFPLPVDYIVAAAAG
jgi:hypothetical protein